MPPIAAAGIPPSPERAGPGGLYALRGLPLSRLAVLLAVLLLIGVWAAVAGVVALKRHDAIEAEKRQNSNLARALAEQTLRVLATADQATVRVRDAVLAGKTPLADLQRLAAETGLAPQILVQLSLVDASGRFLGSNLDPDGSKTGPLDLSQREHIRAHLAPATLPAAPAPLQPQALFIGKPVLGKVSNRWTIQLSRRIAGADGQVQGVVVASLDPTYFEDVYRRVLLGESGGVTLVGGDRGIRARVIGGQPAGMGSLLPEGSAFDQHRLSDEAAYVTTSGIDQVARVYGLRRVAGYPLFVTVATGLDEALVDWRASLRAMLLLAALLSAVVVATTALFVLGLRRLELANAALRLSEAQAQSASQAKSEFLSAVSHELRTPLTSIRGFAELMERRLPEPRQREQAGLIRKAAEHLNELLTEILDLAKVEAGAMGLVPQRVALRPLLQGTADFFALTANAKGLTLALQLAEELPDEVLCDGLRLKQVLNNLLSNAIKFTDHGSVTLGAELRGQELQFHVDDTGPGIDASLHEAIFERFRQGHADVSREHGGTGLGLSLSRALADLMQGRLSVRSQPGHGARFTLAIPWQPVGEPAAGPAP